MYTLYTTIFYMTKWENEGKEMVESNRAEPNAGT